jgi:S-DNA-T family DNA segregation ATPase FtsK/SpoIIIE
MLYSPTGTLEAGRVQWVFVETDEIEAVVNQIKLTVDPDVIENMYDPNIVNGRTTTEWSIMENYTWSQDENSEMVEKAILVVKEAKKASTSLIQRKLGLWYARAAKILDILEELWVVGPSNGSKPREVYVD